jgi:LacI family transcriptional regulator
MVLICTRKKNVEELAEAALNLLFSKITEDTQQERSLCAHKIVLEPQLIVKNSVCRIDG